MKCFNIFPLLMATLLLSACASDPAQQATSLSKKDALPKKPEVQPRQAPVPTVEKKTIVPDINAPGHRGDIARRVLARTSEQFLNADMNRDYLISAEEARQHLPHVSKEFSRYDRNQDNHVSWPELLGHDEWPSPTHP